MLLSLLSIAAILLISSIISVMEYSNMSNYVSTLIAKDINSINVARKLSDVCHQYNLDILTVIGDESVTDQPDFDAAAFMSRCDDLRSTLSSASVMPLADSVEYSYAAYMLASLELQKVLQSDFIDSRTWYFERLQPMYNRLIDDIDNLSSVIYEDLQHNSITFEDGFYRSIVPGIVAVGVGLLLVLMLLYFLTVYYVNPLYKMLRGLDSYRANGLPYKCEFEGDDQLSDLNAGISEVVADNVTLRKRIAALKKKNQAE